MYILFISSIIEKKKKRKNDKIAVFPVKSGELGISAVSTLFFKWLKTAIL